MPSRTSHEDGHPVIAGVMSAFLRAGKCIDDGSSVVLLATIVLCALTPTSALSMATAVLAVLVALLEKYFSWRIALDGELFALLRQYPSDTVIFDATLARCRGRQSILPARSMQSRWDGARRLMRYQVLFFVCQVIIVLELVLISMHSR